MRKNQWYTLTAMTVLVLSLMAFPALAKSTVTFWTLTDANPNVIEKQQKVFDAFEAANPDIELEERIPFPSFDQDHGSFSRGRSDVLLVNSVSLAMFAERGLIQPTGDLLERSTVLSEEDFFPGLWEHVAYHGNSFGLPIDTGTRALVYHKDLLAEAGFDFGDETSWEEFNAATLKMTKDSDGDGITDRFGYAYGTGEKWVALYENMVYSLSRMAAVPQ